MQILFVHQNYPAQFGPIAAWLTQHGHAECVFVSKHLPSQPDGIRCIPYTLKGGARESTHYCARTFENGVWHAHGVFEACKVANDLHPDLIVGHSGFGSTLFLRELYDAPTINYFEYYYYPHGTDMDFRPDYPPNALDVLRCHTRNAMILLDLETCAAGYAPTEWQWSLHGLCQFRAQPSADVG